MSRQPQPLTTGRALAAAVVLGSLVAAAFGGADLDGLQRDRSDWGRTESVNGEFVIGTVFPETGDLAPSALPISAAARLAVSEVNQQGGVLGEPIKLIEGDSGTDTAVAAQTLGRLLEVEHADAVVGAAASRVTLSLIKDVVAGQRPMCSGSSTSDELTTVDDQGFFSRTAPSDSLQAKMVAGVLADAGSRRVAIIAINDVYGRQLGDGLHDRLNQRGIESTVIQYDHRGSSFDAEVERALSQDPDTIYLIGYSETGAKVLQVLRESGVVQSKTRLFVSDALADESTVELVDAEDPTVLDSVVGTVAAAGKPKFLRALAESEPGVGTKYAANAYDCVIVLALAAISAQTDDSVRVSAAVPGVTTRGEPCTSFAECRDLLQDGREINYEGKSGPLEPDETGELTEARFDLWEFRNGKIVVKDTIAVRGP